MSHAPSSRFPLPARVAGPAPDGRLAIMVCPGVRTYGDGIRVEVPGELVPADCRTPGSDLLVGWDRPGEDAPVAWVIKLPCYELRVHLPGPFADEDYRPLIDRVVPPISAALRRQRLGDEVRSWTAGPGSEDFKWECGVFVNDIRQTVTVLREVLTDLDVQPNARIDVCPNDLPFRIIRWYPLAAQSEADDWSDFTEVELGARWPADIAFASKVPCY